MIHIGCLKKGCDNMALVCVMNWKERTLTFPCFSLLKNQCGLTSKQKESLKASENVQLINSSFNGACMKRFGSDLFVPVCLRTTKIHLQVRRQLLHMLQALLLDYLIVHQPSCFSINGRNSFCLHQKFCGNL